MKPRVSIQFDNGNIGAVVPSADGVFGLLASAVAVADTFELNKPYAVTSMKEVVALGILPNVDNYHLYKWLEQFYEEAGIGTKIWLFGFAKNTKVSDWFTINPATGEAPVKLLLDKAKGEISGLFTSFSPDNTYTSTIESAMDADVVLAREKAQVFLTDYTQQKASPVFAILEGYAFNGNHADLATLLEGNDNRVGVFIGANEPRTGTPSMLGASTQTLAGRLARIQVSKNAGEVKAGALQVLETFIVDTPVEEYKVEALYDKGYITYRTHERKAGYFIMDTPLATNPEDDDYRNIELRRTIDKAYKIAYDVAIEELLTDFNVTNQGTISPLFAKHVEGLVENKIFQQMTVKNELSREQSDKDDLGVIAKFDTTINVVATSKIEMRLRVRPRGYVRFYDVLLGFDINLNDN